MAQGAMFSFGIPILAAALATAATAGLIWISLTTGLAHRVMDRPNERSLHIAPTPRTGGICLAVVVLIGEIAVGWQALSIIVPFAVLILLSFLDDVRSLSVGIRSGVHLLAAIVFMAAQSLGLIPAIGLLLVIVWITNLYNFMDGIDGLAGGMALFGFGFYAIAGWRAGDQMITLVAAITAGASLGFLVFNFAPAKIFLGDAGAIPLGFLAAALGYVGYSAGDWTWWFPLIVFLPFLLDATVTLLRRIGRRQRIWQAHRSHFYQRMAQQLGHRRTALAWYAAMAICGLTALAIQTSTFQSALPYGALILAASAVSMLGIERINPFPQA